MRPALLAGVLLISVVGFARTAKAELPSGRGVLLPLQDRVGEEQLVGFTETLLRQELEVAEDLVPPDQVRTVLRSMRIRDAAAEPPERLALLAERLGADWFFVVTLHEARAGRAADRQDGGGPLDGFGSEDDGATPQFTLSARILESGSGELWWAGFRAGTGRDGERAFGLGEVETLEELMRRGVLDLVEEAVSPRRLGGSKRAVGRSDGYVNASRRPSPPDRVAVIPMDSVALVSPGLSAEVVTAALLATLDSFGFRTLLPGFVEAVRREAAQGQNGGVSHAEWDALSRAVGANWVATGTVETYRPGLGEIPDPWVAFSLRFVDCEDGKIGWHDGLELSGSDTAALFDRGRIYSSADLAHRMMTSLFHGVTSGTGVAGGGREN